MSKKLTLNSLGPRASRLPAANRVTLIIHLAALIVVVAGMAHTAAGQQRTAPTPASNRLVQQSRNDEAGVVFRSARDLITDGDWAKAQEKFNQYVSSYPNERNIDAALYWLAYTENKLSKFAECRATIARLLDQFPNTSWKDDARVLLAQVPGVYTVAQDELIAAARARATTGRTPEASVVYAPMASIAPVTVTPMPGQLMELAPVWGLEGSASSDADDDPCEFKIVVLQALFQTDLQRGIMAATEWLKPGSTQTVRCKSAALTLLGRNGGKAVTPVILGVARSEPDLKLRARAISALGATNDDSVVDSLRDFALNSTENDIVEASLYALSRHTGDRAIAVLGEIAISGKLTGQRKMAIASIASRPGEPAVDALLKIYDADQSLEIRKAVIFGFANRKSERAGNKLFDIARGSDNIDLRKAAISGISRRGGEKAVEFLLSLYDTEKSEELKDQIINSLGSGNAIYASTYSGSGVGANTITGVPSAIGLRSRMEDQRVIRKLIEIAKNPQAPMERRKRAIGWLSRSNDPEVLKFLEDLLK